MKKMVTNREGASVSPGTRGRFFRQCSTLLACCPLLLGAFQAHSAIVTLDATKLTLGYLNVFNLPASGSYPANGLGAFQSGAAVPLFNLTSSFGGGSGNSVFLGPNESDNTGYYNASSVTASGFVGNKIMDANLYNETTGLYVDQDLTFTGTVVNTNLLTKFDENGNGWTAVAFIKDFVGNYSSFNQVTVPLTNGTFSITLHTSADAGHHIQWGFEVFGPPIWWTDATPDYVIQIDPVVFAVPVITQPPAPTKAVLGGSATFSVGAAGTITGYQWKTNGVALSDAGGKFSGSTTAQLTVNNCQFSDAVQFSVTVSGTSTSVSATNSLTVIDANKITVNPADGWIGYMNVSGQPDPGADPGGFGSGWGFADLCAKFSGSQLTLSPNIINDPNAYWYIGGGAPGNPGCKQMDASAYVELTGLFQGATMTFSGTVLSTNLLSPSSTNQNGHGWTCTAFIKDFAPDYSSSVITRVDLATNGLAGFSINYTTLNDVPGRHVQWGFETIGPNVWPTDPILPGLGNIVIAPSPYFAVTPSLSGTTLNLSFPTVSGYSYTVQYKNSLADSVWQTLTTVPGTGSTATATDTTGGAGANRFYRVAAH